MGTVPYIVFNWVEYIMDIRVLLAKLRKNLLYNLDHLRLKMH